MNGGRYPAQSRCPRLRSSSSSRRRSPIAFLERDRRLLVLGRAALCLGILLTARLHRDKVGRTGVSRHGKPLGSGIREQKYHHYRDALPFPEPPPRPFPAGFLSDRVKGRMTTREAVVDDDDDDVAAAASNTAENRRFNATASWSAANAAEIKDPLLPDLPWNSTDRIRWSLLYEPLAGRYGIVPADLGGVTLLRRYKARLKHEEDQRRGTSASQNYLTQPLDFGVVADAVNSYSRHTTLGDGNVNLVENIVVRNIQTLPSPGTRGHRRRSVVDGLPGVSQTGMPKVLNVTGCVGARAAESFFGSKRNKKFNIEELRNQRDSIIQTRALMVLMTKHHKKCNELIHSLNRRDREDFYTHVIGARIVFDMGLEDLRFERDDAEESANDLHGPELALVLRRRGQVRASRWWHAVRDQVGNKTAAAAIGEDRHLSRLGRVSEEALGIWNITNQTHLLDREIRSEADFEEVKKGGPGITYPMPDSLQEQRRALLDWVVSDRRTSEDILREGLQLPENEKINDEEYPDAT